VATLVTFHAHPDDEAIATGGVMAMAAKDGHRVVLVVATRGEHAGVGLELLADGETLAERRTAETHAAAEILGVERVEFLGYTDSGMMGADTNDAPGSFWSADVDEAAERLARILREEQADILTIYDEIGGYGHPDHIQVHRVGARAAELAATPRVYENAINRDHFIRGAKLLAESIGADEMPDFEGDPNFGITEDKITTAVDVRDFVEVKRRAMAAHASQIGEQSFFLTMPEEAFTYGFGTEWFIRRTPPPDPDRPGMETSLW
jgi:LmbE family N-acetylglucosaminyl deacetylase